MSERQLSTIFQGAWRGASVGFKLALGYASVIAMFFSLAAFNPTFLVSVFVYALIIGLIPAVFLGAIAGMVSALIGMRFGKKATEWQIVALGWMLGIVFALLLPISVAIYFEGFDSSLTQWLDIITDFGVCLLCPSIVTIFAVGWLVRKAGGIDDPN